VTHLDGYPVSMSSMDDTAERRSESGLTPGTRSEPMPSDCGDESLAVDITDRIFAVELHTFSDSHSDTTRPEWWPRHVAPQPCLYFLLAKFYTCLTCTTINSFIFQQNTLKLEICGTAQLEAAQCPKSDWKYNLGGCSAIKISVSSNPYRPKYSFLKKSTWVGQHLCLPYNIFVSGPKFTKFCLKSENLFMSTDGRTDTNTSFIR